MSDATIDELREVLRAHARLATDVDALSPSADLYDAGMTSHASVNVMLAVEEAFDVEFPDAMLKRSVFESMDSMAQAVEQLRSEAA